VSVVEPFILERSQHPISRRDIDANALKVLYRLIHAGHMAYLVGGSVRDLMMGRRPKDFDVATSAHPHQVRNLFRNSRLIGRRFRLVHVFFGKQNIEVATFRRSSEELLDSERIAAAGKNTFGTAEEDAFRRDFTVNSLFYDPRTFRVIDYVGGVADLHARIIRIVGDPEVRMREDPVRMIRAARFAAKLDFEIEPATRFAIERDCSRVTEASKPRLVEEIYCTLSLSAAARALVLMWRLGLLQILLPLVSKELDERACGPETAPTVRNLEALGRSVAEGMEPSHSFLLACLFADFYLTELRLARPTHRLDLVRDLRIRGFSRGDTGQMQRLLETLPHLLIASHQMRRMTQLPYFNEARRLFELLAPTYGVNPEALARFLAQSPEHVPPLFRPTALANAARPHRPSHKRKRRRSAEAQPSPAPRSVMGKVDREAAVIEQESIISQARLQASPIERHSLSHGNLDANQVAKPLNTNSSGLARPSQSRASSRFPAACR
jgi:poly(A) polymerase